MIPNSQRGPLPHIILASVGDDVRKCANCYTCDDHLTEEMDLTLGEVIRSAARNDLAALTNKTLWACDDVLESIPSCQAELNLVAIVHCLRREAQIRGIAPDA